MRSQLDWSDYRDRGMGDAYADIPKQGGDFAKAVAVCIRSGVCEQPGHGVMCPSFKVSADPALSPGGRVRALKQALNHPEAGYWLDDPQVAETLDLCVSCKGCQRECENNLDMASIKVEYLAQQRLRGRARLRQHLFARFPLWLHRAPWLGQLIRWRNRHAWLAQLGERLLGLAARVPLPEPARRPFAPSQAWFDPLSTEGVGREVVLWIDSFTSQFAPEQAEQALYLLRRAGYRVRVLHPGSVPGVMLDSGRTLLAQGWVEEAREQARCLLGALEPQLQRGLPLIGLEPAALLMMRDEYRQLQLGPLAELARKQAQLLEEFLAHEQQAGRLTLGFKAQPRRLLVHGHCHQKASGAMKSLRRVLKLIPELDFHFIESSCCGMAGTFGLEAEHVALSHQMAAQALLPALAAEPEAELVCNGMACRHQIQLLTGRQPRHLVSLLLAALQEESVA
ncbi:MAG: (Fe-S)-binding protein [Aeromonadaceae bacterium]